MRLWSDSVFKHLNYYYIWKKKNRISVVYIQWNRTLQTIWVLGRKPCVVLLLPCKPWRVLLGLHANSTEGFFLKNLYCLECMQYLTGITYDHLLFMGHLSMWLKLLSLDILRFYNFIISTSLDTGNKYFKLVFSSNLPCWMTYTLSGRVKLNVDIITVKIDWFSTLRGLCGLCPVDREPLILLDSWVRLMD